MRKDKIPVYDICSLSNDRQAKELALFGERFAAYLGRHDQSLHRAHRHSFFHLVLFTKGAGTHTIDFNRFKVAPYQIYFMAPGQVHSWHFEGETDGYIINFSDTLFRSFLLNPNYLERFYFFSGLSEDCVCQLPVATREKATQLLEEIVGESSMVKEGEIDLARLLLMQLFIVVANACGVSSKKTIPQQKQVLLRNFRRLIDQNYLAIKLPKEYADLLYVTPNHLNALCQDLLGKTAGELIRDRVLLEAKRLLTNASITSAEIGYNLNFQDNSYFNRFFKRYAGITPDEFRKQLSIQ